MADHRAKYKNSALDPRELRRRREEDLSQLRKQKREDTLSKRRVLPPSPDHEHEIKAEEFDDYEANITQEMIDALKSNGDDELLITNARKVRKILSKEPAPPFDDVIKSGLVPRFVELLDRDDNTMIQFEIAWILTNISSGTSEQTREVVRNGSVPKLVRLTKSEDMKVCEQAVWALGNIIGDGPEGRDIVISYNFIEFLLDLIRPDLEIGFLRNVTWVVVNVCRNKDPPPHIDIIKSLLPALNFLLMSDDLNILIDTAWAASYTTELGPEYSQLIIDSGMLVRLTPLISHKEIKIQTAAVRALGSIVTGDEHQTQAVIDAGALPHLHVILREKQDRIVKEALWFVSNISAGSAEQIQAIIDVGMIPSIIHHLDNGEFAQQKEAAWTIYNMSLNGNPRQVQVLIDEGVMEPLCNLLNLKDLNLVRNVLETIRSILNLCNENNPHLCQIIETCGGLDKIEQLQESENTDIYEFAFGIIDEYFSE